MQAFKAMKLAEVGKVRNEKKEPQGNGRGEDGQRDDLKRSNDDEICIRSIEEGGS